MTAIHFDLSSFAAVSRLLTSIFLQKSRCLYLIIAWDYTSKIIYHTEKHYSLTEPLFCPHKLAVCQIKPSLWHDIWQTLRKELIAGLVTRQFCWIQIADYDRTGRPSSVGSVWLETSHSSYGVSAPFSLKEEPFFSPGGRVRLNVGYQLGITDAFHLRRSWSIVTEPVQTNGMWP